ncbi:hypothetical protein P7C73_g5030, partial [Tremellales sp. Uapishka_1]
MKVPPSRRTSDAYSPYPPNGQFAYPPPPPQPVSRQSHEEPSDDSPQYKVARAISSCTRCRSRKQKCDGKLPACSACERAKVECIGFDAISKTNVSRNYLFSLEQEVSALKAQVAALTSGGLPPQLSSSTSHHAPQSYTRPPPPPQTISPIETSSSRFFMHQGREMVIDPALSNEGLESPNQPISSPWRRHSDYPLPPTPYLSRPHPTGQPLGINSNSLSRLVADAAVRTGHAVNHGSVVSANSESPIAESSSPDPLNTPRSSRLHGGHSIPPSPLTTSLKIKKRAFNVPPLPPQPAVERLVAAYVDFVGVTAPIIHIPSLGKQLIRVREGTDVHQSDVFMVMMVLALSTMASSRFVDPPDELRACSEAFHAEAMKHLDAVFEEQGYVGLQAILLLVWYALLNPDKGSIWFLVGLATRTCVDLGLHNEYNVQVESLDALELDMRRRLFWCTYKMDRLLSQSLGRPPSMPDGFINVPMPSPLHDIDIHPGHFGPLTGDPCSYKAVFLHTTELRKLQSEILEHTYGIHSMGGGTGPKQEWFDDCFDRLRKWLATIPEPRGTVSPEGFAIGFHNSCLLLFRPSPGCPRPGRNALAHVLASSCYIIRIYRRMQVNNRISWLWMTSHFSFMAGLSFLYAFFNLYSLGGEGVPTMEEAMMDIESCLGVLEHLSRERLHPCTHSNRHTYHLLPTAKVSSAAACHDTLQSVSQAILAQISKLPPPPSSSSLSPGRQFRAPISSSRDEPPPFPAPLPPTTLPYELSLLDNLFFNPMSSHKKASEYTTSKPNGGAQPGTCQSKKEHVPSMNAINGFPSTSSQIRNSFEGGGGGHQEGTLSGLALASNPAAESDGANGANGVGGHEDGFDIFNFLMDEEGGLGATTGAWDTMEVPPDFSIWT